jgi:hypothetical protein
VELRTIKSCGTVIADLQNLTSAILQLSAVSFQFCYFLVPFPQLMMVLKITKNIFRTVCFCENQKLALKRQCYMIFDLLIFFQELTEFPVHTLNYFHMGMIHEKNRGKKSHAIVLLKSSE